MLVQAGYLKTPSKTQPMRNISEFCKYNHHFSHDINYYEESYDEVEKLMSLKMLIIDDIGRNVEFKMVAS